MAQVTYYQGDNYPNLRIYVKTKDSDGLLTTKDLSGCTVYLRFGSNKGVLAWEEAMTVLNATTGLVSYTWSDTAFNTAGEYEGQLRIVDGTAVQHSEKFQILVNKRIA